ncbi:MAG: hypothetical protein V4503_10975, partial [Gemmatimonadota bacterium]
MSASTDANPPLDSKEQNTIDKIDLARPTSLGEVLNRRRHLGYWLGGGSIAGFCALAGFTLWSLHQISKEPWLSMDFHRFCVIAA